MNIFISLLVIITTLISITNLANASTNNSEVGSNEWLEGIYQCVDIYRGESGYERNEEAYYNCMQNHEDKFKPDITFEKIK